MALSAILSRARALPGAYDLARGPTPDFAASLMKIHEKLPGHLGTTSGRQGYPPLRPGTGPNRAGLLYYGVLSNFGGMVFDSEPKGCAPEGLGSGQVRQPRFCCDLDGILSEITWPPGIG